MATPAPHVIEIVSDVVCPWCFIGLRRLDLALDLVREQYPGFACVKRWRPFFLSPDTPPEGEPYMPFMIRKFGSAERLAGIFDRVRTAGALHGVDFRFDRIEMRANTLHAHRLIHWVQERADASVLVERLFAGQFQRGENVGDKNVLVGIAAECGYDRDEVAAYLRSEDGTAEVLKMESESREWGVSAVPTFIVDRKTGVQGAEDPHVLARTIKQALQVRA